MVILDILTLLPTMERERLRLNHSILAIETMDMEDTLEDIEDMDMAMVTMDKHNLILKS